MSFTKQQLLPGEKLILLSRQHILVLAKPVLLNLAVLAILAIVVYKYGDARILFLELIPLGYLVLKFFSWKQREYILTDRRIVKQEGVFSVSSFDAPLDKINNVFHQQSLMGRLFQYGEVGLETASEQGTTVFSFLARPLAFKNSLVSQRELYLGAGKPSSASQAAEVPKLLEDLASLRDRKIISAAEFEEKKKALLNKI
jgi:uncharacterized membrane protein YdbT with pleckstrin-like domain